MTEMIRSSGEQAAAFGTEIVCEGLRRGPEYADCAYDGVIVSHELAQMVQADMRMAAGYDAYVVASFADPALDALRELTDKPVVGIAESALHFASFLGYKFAVTNTLPRLERTFEDEVRRAGASDRLAAVSFRRIAFPVSLKARRMPRQYVRRLFGEVLALCGKQN